MKKCLILCVLVFVLVGCSSASPTQAVVDGYLNAIKNGRDTSPYKDASVDDFINVLDFKFLSVESSKTIDNISTINATTFQKTYRLMYPNLVEAIQSSKRIYGDKAVISESADELIIKVGTQEEHILLYDVTCTNTLGQKVYTKCRFVVRQKMFEKTYHIVDWYQ